MKFNKRACLSIAHNVVFINLLLRCIHEPTKIVNTEYPQFAVNKTHTQLIQRSFRLFIYEFISITNDILLYNIFTGYARILVNLDIPSAACVSISSRSITRLQQLCTPRYPPTPLRYVIETLTSN